MTFNMDRDTQHTHRRDTPKGAHKRELEKSGTGSRRWLVVLVGVMCLIIGLPAALAATGNARLGDGPSVPTHRDSSLVRNGGFEDGLTGWRTSRPRKQSVRLSTQALGGESSVKLSRSSSGRVVLQDTRHTVRDSKAGTRYVVIAHVRAYGTAVPAKLRAREISGTSLIDAEIERVVPTTQAWTRVRLTYTAKRNGSTIDVSVVGARLRPGRGILVDNVSMFERLVARDGTTWPIETPDPIAPLPGGSNEEPTGESSSTPTSNDTPTSGSGTGGTGSGCVSDRMGIPANGTYLGAAVNGTSDLAEREGRLGRSLALHRTYYGASQISGAVRQAKADTAAGRLPWLSFKAPYSWAQMVSGAGDSWAKQLAGGLSTVPGPVWLAVHHEPEGDGDLAVWTKMQARIAPIIHSGTNNVAYSVIYTGWSTFGNDTNTIASKWPGDAHVDILAVDAYNDYGVVRSGRLIKKVLELKTYYEKMAAWSKAHGTAWAIGETGQTREAAALDPTWMDRAYKDMVALGGAGLSYYDSSQNSVADWTLDDQVKFSRFKGLLPGSKRVC